MQSIVGVKDKDVELDVAGGICRGTLYLPAGDSGPTPAVLLGNGFGAEGEFGLEPFLRAFLEAGFACMTFDYRHFGRSTGAPRQLIDPALQLEDWRAALRHLRSHPDVDSSRLALWGTSYGGGHAISIAAESSDVRALVAQVPHCCTHAAFRSVGIRKSLKGIGHGLRDTVRGRLGLSPHEVPIVGEPYEYAVMDHAGWKRAYLEMVPEESTWRNALPARSLIAGGQYRPLVVAERIRCPVLLVYGDRDAGIPADAVVETAGRIAGSRLERFEGDHFDVYRGPEHERILTLERDFLVEHLGG